MYRGIHLKSPSMVVDCNKSTKLSKTKIITNKQATINMEIIGRVVLLQIWAVILIISKTAKNHIAPFTGDDIGVSI